MPTNVVMTLVGEHGRAARAYGSPNEVAQGNQRPASAQPGSAHQGHTYLLQQGTQGTDFSLFPDSQPIGSRQLAVPAYMQEPKKTRAKLPVVFSVVGVLHSWPYRPHRPHRPHRVNL